MVAKRRRQIELLLVSKARLGFVAVVSLAVAAGLAPSSHALAKGPVDKITVAGPGLAAPVEVTGPGHNGFDPWTRDFIHWSRGLANPPPSVGEAYKVSFFLKQHDRSYCLNRDGNYCLRYVVQYLPDPSGGAGYLYIPGPGEPHYRINIGTIGSGSNRWDPQGKWQYATARWDASMRRAIVAVPDKITITGARVADAIEITDPKLLARSGALRAVDWGRGAVYEALEAGTPPANHTYEVVLYKAQTDGDLTIVHTFTYYPHPSESGYVKDGRGDTTGVGTPDLWRYASADWDAFFKRVVEERVALTPAAVPLANKPASGVTSGAGDASPETVPDPSATSVTGDLKPRPHAGTPPLGATPGAGDPVTGPIPGSPSTSVTTDPKPWPLPLGALGVLLGAAAMLWVRPRPEAV